MHPRTNSSHFVPAAVHVAISLSERQTIRREYDHRPVSQKGDAERASVLLPRVHRVFSNLKTWIAGTHHGIGRGHVRSYLDEFVFRFNRRGTPMAAFQSLLGLTAVHGPTTYKALYGREATG